MSSINKTARFAGVLYLIIAVAAIIAHAYVPSTIIVPDDAAATAANISTSASLFRVGGAGSELIILLSEIALSLILYVLLKPVNKLLSAMAAVFRLAMTIIHGVNLLNYFFAILLLSGAGYLAAFDSNQLQTLTMLFLDAHSFGFAIGIAFLVPHVLLLGYLILKSGYFPKILGILFLIAGLGYLIDSFSVLLVPSYETTPVVIAVAIAAAELVFPFWLLIKGVDAQAWKERVQEAA